MAEDWRGTSDHAIPQRRAEELANTMTDTPNWEALEIRRFRGLECMHLHEMRSFNLLLGPNDVGKTSVLEAVFLLSGSGNIALPLKVQLFRSFPPQDIDDLSSLLHRLDKEQSATLIAHSNGGSETRTLSISTPRDRTTVHSAMKPNGKSTSSGEPSITPVTDRTLRYEMTLRSSDSEQPLRFAGTLRDLGKRFDDDMPDDAADHIVPARFEYTDSGYNVKSISKLIVRKKTDELLAFLRLINPRVQGITADGEHAYLDIGLDSMLPMNMFGSGMIRAAAIIAPAILKNERILLIDEIDSGLHFEAIGPLLTALLRISRDRKIQVFATTHSLAVLESLRDVLRDSELANVRDDVSCYSLRKDKTGRVRSYRYGYADLDHCLRNGIEIR